MPTMGRPAIDEGTVRMVLRLIAARWSLRMVARRAGVSHTTVRRIAAGQHASARRATHSRCPDCGGLTLLDHVCPAREAVDAV